MSAQQSLQDGNLEEALAQLQAEVRASPAKAELRVFLFQLMAVLGEWSRALDQLNIAGELDAGTLAMVQTYREALQCEALRDEIFAGARSPLLFGEPEAWCAEVINALALGAAGKLGEAQAARLAALDQAPAVPGTIDGEPFEWIADADSRIGPFLEAVVNGKYYWLPFHRIQAIHLEEPVDLRDLVWLPAHFTWSNGGEAVGLVPSRYPGSGTSEESGIRLARATLWRDMGEEQYFGLGQRMLATDASDYSLLNVREILLSSPVE